MPFVLEADAALTPFESHMTAGPLLSPLQAWELLDTPAHDKSLNSTSAQAQVIDANYSWSAVQGCLQSSSCTQLLFAR